MADITSNLVAHWKFAASDGTDSSGNSNTLTLVGTPTFGTGPFAAAPSIVFNGSSQGGTRALNLTATGAVTVAAWIKATDANSTVLLWELTANYNGAADGLIAFIDTSGNTMEVAHLGNIGRSNGSVSHSGWGSWHHICATHDKSDASEEAKLYIDGVAQTLTYGTNANTTVQAFANNTLFIGSRNSTSLWYPGEIAEIRVYSRELSADDAAALYAYTGTGKPAAYYYGMTGAN